MRTSLDTLLTEVFDSSFSTPRDYVAELEDSFVIEIDLPGVSKSDIDIQFENNYIMVDAKRKVKEDRKERVISSYSRSNYSRAYKCGTGVDPNSIQATYNDGVLTITVGKTPESKAKKISVT